MRTFLALIATLTLAGCATQVQPGPPLSFQESDGALVTYKDRNRDGRVDYELHDFGCCDRNWALVDTDFNGRYDLELQWGEAFERRPVDFPIATGVSISAGDPFDPHM